MRACTAIVAAAILVAAGLAGRADDPSGEKSKAAAYVFVGTVKALKESNVKGTEASDNTVLVKVDRVIKPAEGVATLANRVVTVVLEKPLGERPLQVDQQGVFYTEAVSFGDNIALEEVASPDLAQVGPSNKSKVQETAAPVVTQVQDSSDDALKGYLDQSKAVIFGRVKDVRSVTPTALSQAEGAGKKKVPRRPVSEHNANWHVADVEVLSVEKGTPKQKTVQVYFAQSKDVAYKNLPKFHKDDEGTFVLHTQQPGSGAVQHLISQANAAAVADTDQPPAYTALNPLDFHPKVPDQANLNRIRRLLGK